MCCILHHFLCHSRASGNPVASRPVDVLTKALELLVLLDARFREHDKLLPRCKTHPGFEGVARRKAQSFRFVPCGHAGASRRATCALFGALPRFALLERRSRAPLTERMLICDVCPAPGPAFRFGHRAQLGQRPIAPVQMSASSWQGLLVVPEGAPAPPECDPAKIARGRRTPSRFTTPHDRAPQWMR